MKNWIFALFIFFAGTLLTGCASTTPQYYNAAGTDSSKAYIGMFSGAIIGGLAGGASAQRGGGRFTVAAIGALVGALVGGGIGMIMDEKEHENALKSPSTNVGGVALTNDKWQKSTTTVAADNHLSPAADKAKRNKLLSFWKSLPSTQWFINDGEQAQVG